MWDPFPSKPSHIRPLIVQLLLLCSPQNPADAGTPHPPRQHRACLRSGGTGWLSGRQSHYILTLISCSRHAITSSQTGLVFRAIAGRCAHLLPTAHLPTALNGTESFTWTLWPSEQAPAGSHSYVECEEAGLREAESRTREGRGKAPVRHESPPSSKWTRGISSRVLLHNDVTINIVLSTILYCVFQNSYQNVRF